MHAALKFTTAFVGLACVIQAAPVSSRCIGAECSQSANSGSVLVGSTTNVVPLTQVVPVTRYQPLVQAYAPIVQSACAEPLTESLPFSKASLQYDRFGPMRSGERLMFESGRRMPFEPMLSRFIKRSEEENEASKHHMTKPEGCVLDTKGTESCEQSVPASTVDMGSMVTAEPKNVILPSTVYQGHVKDKGPDIYAAPEQHSALSQANVNLGSNAIVQPVTKVVPSTTYQPSVENKATIVEAAEPQDQSLERSSASLGSTVTIRPVTTVKPLTIYQPKIESLPFRIHDEGCKVVYVHPTEEKKVEYIPW
ncbi:hypothetical protein BX616_010136 [Lobosporangium transversale]|uniref:Uncharacterized protein n=1 Tax=Lobosporangium transversale TaxID=64571 RepID=A0A1Y2GP65_9FUNG|nr:hypothetical protein BCR41DRAFT_386135 [Lobosporangium transversale]KAF9913221.1 hypothetical protein BX616_010136 [Lobosporangium transversale]ORZ17499.1 hypothetical protein BCR41DRAFT_386135 [Lobosporangium transversale]|eukprot:XP_021881886.1 hypothetical protein BCR41DRAFT_386135 [Lobosporangium transversale]